MQGREAFGRTELLALACLLVALSVIGWSVSTFRREAFRTVDSWVQHIAAIYAPM